MRALSHLLCLAPNLDAIGYACKQSHAHARERLTCAGSYVCMCHLEPCMRAHACVDEGWSTHVCDHQLALWHTPLALVAISSSSSRSPCTPPPGQSLPAPHALEGSIHALSHDISSPPPRPPHTLSKPHEALFPAMSVEHLSGSAATERQQQQLAKATSRPMRSTKSQTW